MRTAIQLLLAGSVLAASTGFANAQSEGLQIEYQSAFENYSTWKPKEGWQYYAREPYLKDGEDQQPMQDSGMGHDMSKMKKPMNPGEAHQGGH